MVEPQIDVLELRVHGIANSPPAEMLEAPRDDVVRAEGDEIGSFWRRRTGLDETLGRFRIVREAYSWGLLVRTGGGALAAIGRVLVHLGWLLVLPFALCNLAYWTRRIKSPSSPAALEWHGSRGASLLRLFALVLTLVYVAAFTSVAVDLVAVQCFRDGKRVCAVLPSWLDGLLLIDRDARSALFGILPIAAMLLIYLIARRGRVTYEANIRQYANQIGQTASGLPGAADVASPKPPLLATRGFWGLARVGQTSERLHFAASIALVLLLLCWDSLNQSLVRDARSDDACWGEEGAVTCFVRVLGGNGFALAGVIVAAVLLVGTAVFVMLASSTIKPPDPWTGGTSEAFEAYLREHADKVVRRQAWQRVAAAIILATAVAAYVGWFAVAFAPVTPPPPSDPDPRSLGLIAAPNLLVALALVLAFAGAAWGRGLSRGVSIPLLLASFGFLVVSFFVEVELASILAGIAGVLLVVYLVVVFVKRGDPLQAWSGFGPTVVMLLALFASMFLSSLLVLGVASWLSTPADPGKVEDIWRIPAPPGDLRLDVPDAYERFAVLLTATVIATLLVIVSALARNLVTFALYLLPSLDVGGGDGDPDRNVAGVSQPTPPPYPLRARQLEGRERKIVAARRSSSLLHRGEPLFGWLAGFAAVALLAIVSPTLGDAIRGATPDPVEGGIQSAASMVLVLVALSIVAAVAAHAASSAERPIALFWDVVCFFPRAGHPFAPPCYAERTVPELRDRVLDWLKPSTTTKEPAAHPRRVVLAVHSMGATIATAAILSMRGESVPADASDSGSRQIRATDRVALLSYGIQLRPYFSRFFPSVFGPEVLGVPGTHGPSLFRMDPWSRQVVEDWKDPMPAVQLDAWTLTETLGATPEMGPRWRSLWRRTDYLGFPVFSYRRPGNPVDRGASERAPLTYLWKIARHNDYLGTLQYSGARQELLNDLAGAPDDRPAMMA
jgi:hypothetical protein